MATMAKKTHKEMETALGRSQSSDIEAAQITRGTSTQPVTFRASSPLLERLDALAEREHRTRANLIQHILWMYVHEQEIANKKR